MAFLDTTTLLMESVRRGAGREQVHEAVRELAVDAALRMRDGREADGSGLVKRLGEDDRIPLTAREIEEIIDNRDFVGGAPDQVSRFNAEVDALIKRYPESRKVSKGRLL